MPTDTLRFCIALNTCLALTGIAWAQADGQRPPLVLKEPGHMISFLTFAGNHTLAYGLYPNPAHRAAPGAFIVRDYGAQKDIFSITGKFTKGALSADGKTLAVLHDVGPVSLWNVPGGRKIQDCENSRESSQFAFLPDGTALLGSFFDGIYVWDAATGKLLRKIGSARGYAHFAIAADGKTIRTERRKHDPHDLGGGGGKPKELEFTICLSDVATGKELWTVTERVGPTSATWGSFSSTRGGQEHGFRVHIAPGGKPFFTPPRHRLPLLVIDEFRQGIALSDFDGKKIHVLPALHSSLETVVFSLDGRRLALFSAEPLGPALNYAVIHDLSQSWENEQTAAKKRIAQDLHSLWSDLGEQDSRAHRAMFVMGLLPDEDFSKFMQKRIPTIAPADRQRIERLIGELASETVSVREHATRELQRLVSQQDTDILRQALKGSRVLEQKRGLEQILDTAASQPFSRETQRGLRVIDLLLERRSPQSQALLQTLSQAATGSWVGLEAKAAVAR